jgi:methyl-accepting chemotaxis protein
MHKTLPRSFLLGFVLKSTLIFAGGALSTAALFFLFRGEPGTSYVDSYKLLAELNHVLVNRSLILFSFSLLLSLAGIIVLAIVYSHRVAGALHMLGMHTRRIASGDLTRTVRLRNTDVVHELAGDFNKLSDHYKGLLVQLEVKTRELSVSINSLEMQPPGEGDPGSSGRLSEKVTEIRELLDQIKL